MKTWQSINAERLRYANYGTLLFRRMLKQVRIETARLWAESGDFRQHMSRAEVERRVRSAYEDMYTATGTAFAEKQISVLKSKVPGLELKEDMKGVWRRHMLAFVDKRCGEKIGIVTRTLFEDIERMTQAVIREGAAEGWGASRVGTEIMKRVAMIDEYRAMRIARTEVVGASNEGSFMGSGSLSIRTIKTWIATSDGNTRDDHLELDGRQRPHDDPFEISGDKLMYPGDPSGSAGQVINCRCACSYEPETSYIDQLLNE